MSVISRRNTKYTIDVKLMLAELGHASNAQLLSALQKDYPTLSATTVHRVTQRLVEEGAIAKAPANSDGSARFDINLQAHDHFMCSHCDGLKDIKVPDECSKMIQRQVGECAANGPLTISGNCHKCIEKENK